EIRRDMRRCFIASYFTARIIMAVLEGYLRQAKSNFVSGDLQMTLKFYRVTRRAVCALTFLMLGLLSVQPAMISFAAGIDGEVWWAQNYHDSRDPLYRTPGGPVPVGTVVTLRFRSEVNDLTAVEVRVWNDRTDTQTLLNMEKFASDATH